MADSILAVSSQMNLTPRASADGNRVVDERGPVKEELVDSKSVSVSVMLLQGA